MLAALPMGADAEIRDDPRWERSSRVAAKTQGRKRSLVQVMRSPSRRQMRARPSRFAHTETMPGKGSQPKRYSSSVWVLMALESEEDERCISLLVSLWL